MKIPTVKFLGINFADLSAAQVLDRIRESVDTYRHLSLRYVDTKTLFRALFSRSRRQKINQFSIIVPRGSFIVKRIRRIFPSYAYRYEEATEFVAPIMDFYKEAHHSFAFFGHSQLGLNRLGLNLQASFPGITLMGLYAEDFVRARNEDIRAMIRKGDVRVLCLGMGTPKDEEWAMKNRDVLEQTVVLCVNSDVQVMSGELKVIPWKIRQKGKEFFYLLLRNPFRILLGYRYLVLLMASWVAKWKCPKKDQQSKK